MAGRSSAPLDSSRSLQQHSYRLCRSAASCGLHTAPITTPHGDSLRSDPSADQAQSEENAHVAPRLSTSWSRRAHGFAPAPEGSDQLCAALQRREGLATL